jgi:hypothetical protein
MVYTLLVVDGLKTYIADRLNDIVAEVAAATEISLGDISSFIAGFQDPLALSRYNALIIVPDRVNYNRVDQTATMPIDFVAAIRASNEEKIWQHQAGYGDALNVFFERYPKLGGLCFDVGIESTDYYAPVPGNKTIGVVVIRANLTLDERAS